MAPRLMFDKHIRPESRRIVKKIVAEYGIDDAGGIQYLMMFAAADTMEREAQAVIDEQGLTVLDRFGQTKSHPMCADARNARSQKMAALKALNLDLEPLRDGPGRPGG